MNIDETLIEAAITPSTKAIVPVHYAGVGCEMDTLMEIANKYSLFVIEDAAQGMMATYNGKALGTIGHIGCFSFHETKNYTSGGEGGLLILNDEKFIQKAEIIREKGTNRSQFFRGQIDKYSWVDLGSSYLPSELQTAYLYAQLLEVETINNKRLELWERYYAALTPLIQKGYITLPTIPKACQHNGHMFYIKTKNLETRTRLISYLKEQGILAVFHYVPLHSAKAGKHFGKFHGDDNFTTKESERLLRLPMFYQLTTDLQIKVIDAIRSFFK
jgi:dTDP-4-amino-4,6-dideoxygalactose transaminase